VTATGFGQEFALRRTTAGGQVSGIFTLLPRVETDLRLEVETYDSEEVGISRDQKDSRHGMRAVSGTYETELDVGAYDDLFLSLLGRSAWSSPTVLSPTPFYVRVYDLPVVGSQIYNEFGAWPPIVAGEVLSVATPTYAVETVVIGQSLDGRWLYVADNLPESDAVVGLTVVGRARWAQTGVEYVRFAVERANRDVVPTLYQLFTDVYASSLDVGAEPQTMAGLRWGLRGREAGGMSTSTSNTYYAGLGYREPERGVILDALSGIAVAMLDGTPVVLGVVTEYQFSVDSNLQGASVVGADVVPDLVWGGAQTIAGRVTMLLSDDVISSRFDADLQVSLVFRMAETVETGDTRESVSFVFPACQLTAVEHDEDSDVAILQVFEFKALRPRAPIAGMPTSQVAVFLCGHSEAAADLSVVRITTDGDVRVTTDGDTRVATVANSEEVVDTEDVRTTTDGDLRVTSTGDTRIVSED